MIYHGILIPFRHNDGDPCLDHICGGAYTSWCRFFEKDGIIPSGHSIATAIKAYEAIGVQCVKLDVRILPDDGEYYPKGEEIGVIGGVTALYEELLFAVESKHPGETRHETALRYIRERESRQESAAMTEREEE